MRSDSTEFILCTDHSHGLYSRVAGTLTACGINILGSHVYTTHTGIALQVYRLSTPGGGREEIQMAWRDMEKTLERVLAGGVRVDDLLRRRRLPAGKARTPSTELPGVLVSNRESEFYTIADVTANDRIGLLYDLTRAIEDLGFEIYISKVATTQDQVADSFYIKDREGGKIRTQRLLVGLEQALMAAVTLGEDVTGG
jgi:[protein-PII] uridylyltransferase